MQRNIRAAAAQFQSKPADKAYNRSRVEHFVEQAAREGVELLAFPECCLTGYWFLRKQSRQDLLDWAEPVPQGESAQWLQELARRHGMVIGVGLLERDANNRLYNAYAVALPDGALHCHRKLHAFIHPDVDNGEAYTVFDTPLGCRVGVLICYDNNLIENARMNALMGAEVLLSPHQTGGCRSRSPHAMGAIDPALWHRREQDPAAIEAEFRGSKGRGWLMRWLPARAHDNGLFLIFSNGVGQDDDEVRTGNAMIIDPYGRILAETSAAQDHYVAAELDAALQPESTGRRWLKARRPELYAPLAKPVGIEETIRDVRFGQSKPD